MLYQEEMASARCISKGEYDRVAGPNRSRIAKAPVTKRDYDVCIVFNYKPDRNVMFDERQEEIQEPVNRGRVLRAPTTEETALMHVWREQRQSILKSLQNCGLRLLCFYSRDGNEVFCKIGASAQKLKAIAAKMKYKLQLKPEYLGAHAEYRHDFPGRPALDHGDRRIVSHMYRVYTDDEFHGEDAIFSTRDKICIIEYIINSRNKDCAGLGLGNLLHEQQIKGFFAIHEKLPLARPCSKTSSLGDDAEGACKQGTRLLWRENCFLLSLHVVLLEMAHDPCLRGCSPPGSGCDYANS